MGAFIDLTGKRFDKLTVVSRAANSSLGSARWNCLCECGGESTASGTDLRKGHTKSCGCLRVDVGQLKIEDLVGQVFSRLTVLSFSSRTSLRRYKWNCLCNCGNSIIVQGSNLKNGNTKSCGCLQIEATTAASTTHGKSDTDVYHIWVSMVQRCENPSKLGYKNYGGRGVAVCDEWKDFANFYVDMGDRPPKMSIDRIDNSKGYSKDNCRWATQTEQARNKRNNKVVSYRGENMVLSDLTSRLGVSRTAVTRCIDLGMTDDEIDLRVAHLQGLRYNTQNLHTNT